jgi:hypothetical protein
LAYFLLVVIEGREKRRVVASHGAGDGAITQQLLDSRIDAPFEFCISLADGNRDVPVVLRYIARHDLELELGRGVQCPTNIGPEVSEVNRSAIQRFEHGQLVAEQAALVAALSETIVGDGSGFRT